MDEITVALIAIALVLSAVFLPDGVLRRFHGRHLPPVLADDHLRDDPVGAGRADPVASANRNPC